MKVPVPPGRATVEDDGTTISISAPAGRSWMAILFYPVWFCGWAAGELFALAFRQMNDGVFDRLDGHTPIIIN